MKILGTGLNGLVGSRIVELLKNKYEFENISRKSGIDIVDRENVIDKIKNSDAKIILHLAAKSDVDACEKDKFQGKEGEAWKVNVSGTQNIVDACSEGNKKLIYISTDFVFDGANSHAGGYSEEDTPSPINWYAKTKYESEKIIQNALCPWLITRISYPYRANFEKLDFLRAILNRLKEGKEVWGVTDQIFTPTFIDDVVVALDILIEKQINGIFHVVGSQSLSPYEASVFIANEFGFDSSKINKITRSEFFKDRASRPFQLAIKNDKIRKLGIKMKTFEEGLREIRVQMSNS